MTAKEKTQLRRKWKRWFKKICHQTSWLVLSQYVWKEIGKIIDNNANINVPSLFYDWLSANYVAKLGTTIRSLVEEKKSRSTKHQTISLHILLEDIAEHYEVFSKDYFYKRLRVSSLPIRRMMANGLFNEFATAETDYISPIKIKGDLKELKRKASQIETFVDKQIAHFDLSKDRYKLPTFEEVDEVIAFLEMLIGKYNQLLGADEPPLMPTITYDWKKPLKYAWVEMRKSNK